MASLGGMLLLTGVLFSRSPNPDLQGLLPDSLRWDSVTFYGRTVEGQDRDGQTLKAAVFEKFRFDEVGLGQASAQTQPGGRIDEESSLGARISRIVEDTLAKAFGRGGGKPDFAYLSKVFQGTHKGILKGKLMPGKEERVQYFWESPDTWIGSLKEMALAGKRFNVSLGIIWLYQDVRSRNRFWAVVKQEWETVDSRGRSLYRDDGFLFLNFDLDERKQPRDIKVQYRLWFYNYKRPDSKSGHKPHQRLAQDIRGALDPSSRVEVNFGRVEGDRWVADPGERGLSGIDRDLVNRMASDLVNGIRAARGE